jgi:hypothetical protein
VMTVRDSITRTGARTPGAEDYPTSMAAHVRAPLPTQCGITEIASTCAKDRHKPHISRCMPGAGLSRPCVGRCCPTCQPSSRIGENPPYGMIGRVEETSASFEARSAPRLYPTAGGARQLASLPRRRVTVFVICCTCSRQVVALTAIPCGARCTKPRRYWTHCGHGQAGGVGHPCRE